MSNSVSPAAVGPILTNVSIWRRQDKDVQCIPDSIPDEKRPMRFGKCWVDRYKATTMRLSTLHLQRHGDRQRLLERTVYNLCRTVVYRGSLQATDAVSIDLLQCTMPYPFTHVGHQQQCVSQKDVIDFYLCCGTYSSIQLIHNLKFRTMTEH